MRYNGDKSTNLQFSSLNGLTDAIENAVNLILDYEKEHDRKMANTASGYGQGGEAAGSNYGGANSQQENHRKASQLDSGMNRYNGMGNQLRFTQQDAYQPLQRPFYEGLKLDQPIYEMQNNENAMGNNQNYNQNDEQTYEQKYNQEDNQIDAYPNGNQPDRQYGSGQQYDGNQMESPYNQMHQMGNGYQASHSPQGSDRPVLTRNQRYIKKLYCKTKKNTRTNKLKSRNLASGSSQYDDYMMIRNSYDYIPFTGFYSNFNELDSHGEYKGLGNDFGAPAQVVRYPVYVSEYDTDLIHRLYSIRNAFI